jgi:hypothetical protein
MNIAFSRKSFDAVILGLSSTWLSKCAHTFLIRPAESPAWYFISILLFHIQKLFNWFSKYVWYFVPYICVKSCVQSWNDKISSIYRMNRYQQWE